MDGISCFVFAVMRGIKDSIWGIKSIRRLSNNKEKRPSTKQVTTLSIRRQRQEVNSEAKPEETKLTVTILQCSILNGLIMCSSIAAFDYLIVPSIYKLLEALFGERAWYLLDVVLHALFRILWIIPLYGISRFINILWFQDVADAAYKSIRGRPQPVPSLSNWFADYIFSCIIQALFLMQSHLVTYLPIIGNTVIGWCVRMVHLSLLYSFYAFEYKWINMGWGLHKRLSYLETNWPYFVGFGLPLAVATELMPNFEFSGGVFGVLFPFFIVSANEATPLIDTCEYPLRLFRIVVYISNRMPSLIMPSNRKHKSS